MDRADVRLLLGVPGAEAAFGILASSLAECVRAGLVGKGGAPPPPRLEAARAAAAGGEAAAAALLALAASPAVAGLSGRSLRRLPFLAFAAVGGSGGCACDLLAFIRAVGEAAAAVAADRAEE